MKTSAALILFAMCTGTIASKGNCGCGNHASHKPETSICPKTCANRDDDVWCDGIAPGCECDEGYIFKNEQKYDCVTPDQCPPRCGKHATYVNETSVCPTTCGNKDQSVRCYAIGPGCECDEGYIFKENQKGDCVKPQQCPPKCGKHATYQQSASVCPRTCAKQVGPICFALAPGCKCDKGYIFKNDRKGDCVKPDQCPPNYCPSHENIMCIRAEYHCCKDSDCGHGQICCAQNCGNFCRSPQSTKSENGTRVTYDDNCRVTDSNNGNLSLEEME